MAATRKPVLQPRKTPVQTRSAVTVEAILDAAIQVLLVRGKERLTTILVAARAGVSVGTLYQYFPNKSALLQACLRRHLDEVVQAMEEARDRHRGFPLLPMATALADAYLGAKMRHVQASKALYAGSSDVDGATISRAATVRVRRAVTELLCSAREGLNKEGETVASMVIAAMNGTARRLLESKDAEREMAVLRGDLARMLHAYLQGCAALSL